MPWLIVTRPSAFWGKNSLVEKGSLLPNTLSLLSKLYGDWVATGI